MVTTTAGSGESVIATPAPAAARRGGALVRSGWVPAAVAAVATLAVLLRYDTPLRDIAVFTAYIGLAVTLPGTLLYRAARGRSGWLAEDLAMGLAVGYALQIAAYLPLRAAGLPQLAVVPLLAIVAVFAAVPALRRHWRGSGTTAPTAYAWLLCALVVVVLLYAAGTVFWSHGLHGGVTPYVDVPFHLSLIAEAKNHAVPTVPYVLGEPLTYHWFVYSSDAAASWATGVEPQTLLVRLASFPMIIGFLVAIGGAARRLSGLWWPAGVAMVVALLSSVANPYGWLPEGVYQASILTSVWLSPTNTLGLILAGALVFAAVDVFRPGSRTGMWLVFSALALALTGAKGSQLPVLLAAAVLVLIVSAVRERRLHRQAFAATGVLAIALMISIFVIFDGYDGVPGDRLLGGVWYMQPMIYTGLNTTTGTRAVAAMITALAVAVALWGLSWAGAFGLAKGKAWADPATLFVLGGALAGLGAACWYAFPGWSQVYFLRGAAGQIGVIVAAGLAGLVPTRPGRRTLLAVAGAIAFGAVAGAVVHELTPDTAPKLAESRFVDVVWQLVWPALAVTLGVVIFGLIVRTGKRRAIVPVVVPVALVAAMATGLPHSLSLWRDTALPPAPAAPANPSVPRGGFEAARWIRAHSAPTDLVATNMHCRWIAGQKACFATHFWVSAYSERRVLVEGWAYTATATITAAAKRANATTIRFWDPTRLADNDAAFTRPTAATVETLRTQYGVRFLLADLTLTPEAAGLAGVARQRFADGGFAVYELTP